MSETMVLTPKQIRKAESLARALVIAVSNLKEQMDVDVLNEAVRIAHDRLDMNGLYASGNTIALLRESKPER